MLEILGKTNIDFMGKRKFSFLFSGIMVLLGLIALVQIARGSANLGIDFAGGTAVQLKFEQPVRIDEARKALEANGLSDVELQEFGQDNKLLIRVKASTTIEEKIAERVVGIFAKEFPANKFVVDSTTEIGPTIGKKLQEDALVAIVVSFAGIILYIAARFELRFGIAAALATFHDVLAVVGAFYLLDKEITLLIVTALLTLAGYSLTDTVVVFDRIRENSEVAASRKRRSDDQRRHQSGVEPYDRHQFDRRARPDPIDPGRGRSAARFLTCAALGCDFRHLFIGIRGQPTLALVAGNVGSTLETVIARIC